MSPFREPSTPHIVSDDPAYQKRCSMVDVAAESVEYLELDQACAIVR